MTQYPPPLSHATDADIDSNLNQWHIAIFSRVPLAAKSTCSVKSRISSKRLPAMLVSCESCAWLIMKFQNCGLCMLYTYQYPAHCMITQ